MTKGKIPPSASSFFINLIGGLSYILAANITFELNPQADVFTVSIVSVTAALVPIICGELLFLNVHKRPGVGLLETPLEKNPERLQTKLLGYYGSLALMMSFYIFIPLYSNDEFFIPALSYFMPLLMLYIVGGAVYFSEMDCRLENPYDSYWHFGNFLSGRWADTDRAMVVSHVKSIALRACYIPMMLSYFSIYISTLMKGHNEFLAANLAVSSDFTWYGVLKLIMLAYFFLGAMDILFGLIGYFMTFRVLDSHIRSTDPTLIGWLVCLICYYPFWELFMISVFFQDFYSNPEWHEWFKSTPVLMLIWGTLAIVFMCTESLTTLTFGIRFSNLTYRGVITAGLFRFTKHPQYVSKMFNRFFWYVPILSLNGAFGSLQTMIMFAGICFIYYLRARTEENHLSRYPEYVEYANWINENGIFRFLGKYFPFLVYSEEKAKAGKLF
ncbi:MAG: hypothetical protein KDI65_04615 [Alphaproteobacteria bacterium]|nr:hypothetical protein [Alphaproteobacteria bacterium]